MGGSIVQSRISGPVPEGLIVIETMRAEAGAIRLLPLHLTRLRRDCDAVGFPLDEDTVLGGLAALPREGILRVRLTVDARGRVDVVHQDLPDNPLFWNVEISALCLDSFDPWLRVKTSQRQVYDAARQALAAGVDEAILQNERGEICEGTITNLFLRRGKRLLTPTLDSGLLPGVLRASLLASGEAEEATLFPPDLEDGDLMMGNALRGLIPARLVNAAT